MMIGFPSPFLKKLQPPIRTAVNSLFFFFPWSGKIRVSPDYPCGFTFPVADHGLLRKSPPSPPLFFVSGGVGLRGKNALKSIQPQYKKRGVFVFPYSGGRGFLQCFLELLEATHCLSTAFLWFAIPLFIFFLEGSLGQNPSSFSIWRFHVMVVIDTQHGFFFPGPQETSWSLPSRSFTFGAPFSSPRSSRVSLRQA